MTLEVITRVFIDGYDVISGGCKMVAVIFQVAARTLWCSGCC